MEGHLSVMTVGAIFVGAVINQKKGNHKLVQLVLSPETGIRSKLEEKSITRSKLD